MGCRAEYENLWALYQVVKNHFPAALPAFSGWNERMEDLREVGDFETPSIEYRLNSLSLWFRSLWLKRIQHLTSYCLKSPNHFRNGRTLKGEAFNFAYDRWSRPAYFEKLYADSQSCPAGWSGRHLFFSSAMAAFSTLMFSHRQLCDARQTMVLSQKGYFEFRTFFRNMVGQDMGACFCETSKTFHQRIANGFGNIILIEPVWANDELTMFDMDGFMASWRQRTNREETLILLDTSLVGNRFGIKDFMSQLDGMLPAGVIQLVSGLKLHEQGLEFSNWGILSFYVAQGSPLFQGLGKTEQHLRLMRQTFGASMDFSDLAALELPLHLTGKRLNAYCETVFSNNASLAKAMRTQKGMVKEVIHPSLINHNDKNYAVAPYVIFHLHETDPKRLLILKRILHHMAKRRKISFQSGSSFGFRYHRFEVNEYNVERAVSFRVAMGAVDGPSMAGVITLLREVLSYPDLGALKDAHKEFFDDDE